MVASNSLNESITEFKLTIEEIINTLRQTDEGLLYQKPSSEEWSSMQIVSHIIEAIHFWKDDLEALLIVPGAKWGRNHEHVRRLAAVNEKMVEHLTKEEAISKLQNLIDETTITLLKVNESDLHLTAPSYNPNFDGKSILFLIDHLIIKHVVSHRSQINRHLDKVKLMTSKI